MLWTAPVLGPLRWLEPQPGGALLMVGSVQEQPLGREAVR